MLCQKCGKEVDVSKHDVPPKWYGTYCSDRLEKVTCSECEEKKRGKHDNKKK